MTNVSRSWRRILIGFLVSRLADVDTLNPCSLWTSIATKTGQRHSWDLIIFLRLHFSGVFSFGLSKYHFSVSLDTICGDRFRSKKESLIKNKTVWINKWGMQREKAAETKANRGKIHCWRVPLDEMMDGCWQYRCSDDDFENWLYDSLTRADIKPCNYSIKNSRFSLL